MSFWPLSTYVFFSRTGSSMGSSSSSTFSKRNGAPNWMASSRCFMKSLSLRDLIFSWALPYMFLIQFTACCCGSMQRGNREAAVVKMPFCTLCSSAGRPFAVQSWMTASKLKKLSRLNAAVTGTPSDATFLAKVS